MPITTVRGNENNKWKRNANKQTNKQQQKKKNKDRKEQGGQKL